MESRLDGYINFDEKRSAYIHASHAMQCQSSLSVALDEDGHTFIKSTCIGVTGHSVL